MGRGTATFLDPSLTHYSHGAFGAWILPPMVLDLGPSRLLILDPPLTTTYNDRGTNCITLPRSMASSAKFAPQI